MGRPVIGVLPQYDAIQSRIMIVADYFRAISAAGGVPVLLPLESEPQDLLPMLDLFDGFLYPGGPDINPLRYGEDAAVGCGMIVPERDRLELGLLAELRMTGKPVLGICRGIQVMNVAFGGTLVQDISSDLAHYQKAGDEVQTQRVQVKRHTLLHDIVKRDTLLVNSFHHQACARLGSELVQNAVAADGTIEAIALEGHQFFLGVQWHPEHLFWQDEATARLWRAFVSAAKRA
ncbi:MAG: gamma-glutamyl-gamma-aminobutyrate hydrolase family protein [Lachnospiraceae bacterium]|nr:gamma-glutamyl-gamma-aminobutyrate hydrolase family protein [Lachnospiraceae bacterium]